MQYRNSTEVNIRTVSKETENENFGVFVHLSTVLCPPLPTEQWADGIGYEWGEMERQDKNLQLVA